MGIVEVGCEFGPQPLMLKMSDIKSSKSPQLPISKIGMPQTISNVRWTAGLIPRLYRRFCGNSFKLTHDRLFVGCATRRETRRKGTFPYLARSVGPGRTARVSGHVDPFRIAGRHDRLHRAGGPALAGNIEGPQEHQRHGCHERVASLLAWIGTPAAVQLLQDWAQSDPRGTLGSAAASALKRI